MPEHSWDEELRTGRYLCEAAALLVAKVDRLSRSLADFTNLMTQAERNGWKIIALDLGVDTTTASGEMLANVVAAISQYERRLISARTKDALSVRRAAGVRLGRPRLLDSAIAARIREERADGSTLQAIADALNLEDIETPTGRQWSAALVRKVAMQDA